MVMRSLFIICFLCSLSLVLILGLQNRHLAQRLAVAEDKIDFPYESMYVPFTVGLDINGGSVPIGRPNNTSQVLFFLNTSCPHCLASLPAVKRLAGSLAKRPSSDFYLVSEDALDQTKRYAGDHPLSSNMVVVTDAREISLFHARSVPTLIVVDKNGRVVMSRVGSLNDREDVDAVLAAVHALEAPAVADRGERNESFHP
jgi:thioredoxin-related protein